MDADVFITTAACTAGGFSEIHFNTLAAAWAFLRSLAEGTPDYFVAFIQTYIPGSTESAVQVITACLGVPS